MLLSSVVKDTESNRQLIYAKMLSGQTPIFTRFGTNIYASDVVQMCIDKIAVEMSKLQPAHVRVDDNEAVIDRPKSRLSRLFKFGPNELMTTRDFIEKTIWLLYLNYNAFIYPKKVQLPNGGWDYEALWPLNPTQVSFLQDLSNRPFVKFRFDSGEEFTLAYSDVIHLRKKFSQNDVMGGGVTGQPDNTALLKVLDINDTVLQGLEKAIKTSLSVRGVMKINTLLDDGDQRKERERFEKLIESGSSGILPVDLKGEYIDLKVDPKILDKETLEFLEKKILRYYGVSVPILSGDFNDEQYQAFYESPLEPLVISLGQAFTKCLFSSAALDHGNRVLFFHRNMMYLSTSTKLNVVKTLGEQGLLTDDQKLGIFGYQPLPNGQGNRRTISLNFISTDIADEYQLLKAKAPINQGGTGNEE